MAKAKATRWSTASWVSTCLLASTPAWPTDLATGTETTNMGYDDDGDENAYASTSHFILIIIYITFFHYAFPYLLAGFLPISPFSCCWPYTHTVCGRSSSWKFSSIRPLLLKFSNVTNTTICEVWLGWPMRITTRKDLNILHRKNELFPDKLVSSFYASLWGFFVFLCIYFQFDF